MTNPTTIPIRNIALIAHVDHGKTTLVDGMLRQSGLFRSNQVVQDCIMDSEDLERERGITILAKNCALVYRDTKINIIDTPGHADFGGEVERVLSMADGVLLLVDAFEGPMPQTRFVLRKALEHGLIPIVVINKIDRTDQRATAVLDEILDLFIDLDADDSQLDFPVLYASGRGGYASLDPHADGGTLVPLFDTILESIPPPSGDNDAILQMQVANIAYNEFVGRMGIGRIYNGHLTSGQTVWLDKGASDSHAGKIRRLEVFDGLGKSVQDRVESGDIAVVTGLEDIAIGDTLTDADQPKPMHRIAIEEPTITMNFLINTSPFAGKEGKYVTSRQLGQRLERELRSNLALSVEVTELADCWKVSGRGLLHLSILIETMRREGYELAVSKPNVIMKTIDGKTCEPVEEVVIDCQEEYSGRVIELLGQRRGILESMATRGQSAHLEFKCPSRGLIGLRNQLLNGTKGTATFTHIFNGYEPFRGEIRHRNRGVCVASDPGRVTEFALFNLQDRGRFVVKPGENIYPGQIVGEHCHESDIDVNASKTKHLTNMRSSNKDFSVRLMSTQTYSLEEALEYIDDDELVEVTPVAIRMRKIELDPKQRRRQKRDRRKDPVLV